MHISPVTSISVGISRNKVEKLEKFSWSEHSLKRTFCLQQKGINIDCFEKFILKRIKFNNLKIKFD